ncbi:MAG: hypothetical protein VB980_03345 [Opitutales bacterium]|jgi:hypothetical protein
MKKLSLIISVLIGTFLFGCKTPTHFKKEETIYPKNNLEILLHGKNHLEVTGLLGQPDGFSQDSSGRVVTWEYRREVLDEETGLTFYLSRIWLTFEKGICEEVLVELL